MTDKPLRIGIVAGETSGDILGAGLLAAIRKQYPDAVFEGIAGPKMQNVGCQSLFDMEELSVMGLVEVLSRIRRLLFVRKTLVQHFTESPPDIFIGVDAPDFNLGVEMRLKKKGIKTLHYVSPTIWAWREGRVHKIARAADKVLCLFPFEPSVYQKHNVDAAYVGHTLADQIPIKADRKAAREFLDVPATQKVLALLPGSRAGEVKMLLEVFVKSADVLAAKVPDLLVLIPVVNRERKAQIEQYLEQHPPKANIRIVIGHSREVMTASNLVLLASGTATLEAMLCKRPMVVAYRMKGLTYQMMKVLYKANYFSLPNILADELLVPELLQEDVNPELICSHLMGFLEKDPTELEHKFELIHEKLKQGASEQAAKAALETIGIVREESC